MEGNREWNNPMGSNVPGGVYNYNSVTKRTKAKAGVEELLDTTTNPDVQG